VAVRGSELVGVDTEVVRELELGLLVTRNSEEVVDGLVADRQLAKASDRSGSVIR
jgi:hypothetical protein